MKVRKDGRHPFKWMKYDGYRVAIDENIATLLSKMWKLGIRTTNSCQAHCAFTCKHKYKVTKYKNGTSFSKKILTKNCHNNIWLVFESVKDVERLYNIVAEYSETEGSMYHKMGGDRTVNTRTPNGWSFVFAMTNNGVYGHWGRPKWGDKRSTCMMWIEDGCDKNNFVVQPQLAIPHIHLKFVEEKLDSALKQKKK